MNSVWNSMDLRVHRMKEVFGKSVSIFLSIIRSSHHRLALWIKSIIQTSMKCLALFVSMWSIKVGLLSMIFPTSSNHFCHNSWPILIQSVSFSSLTQLVSSYSSARSRNAFSLSLSHNYFFLLSCRSIKWRCRFIVSA